jgi:cyanate permease
VNQVAVVAVPPALGMLVDVTGGFTPGWALVALSTAVAWAATANTDRA